MVMLTSHVTAPGPLQVHSKEWLRDFPATLLAQDSQPAFRAKVVAIAAAAPQQAVKVPPGGPLWGSRFLWF
jgi:hypothetical protein